jgi:hypothetical protein
MKKAAESITFLLMTFGWLSLYYWAKPMPSVLNPMYLIDNTKQEKLNLRLERPSWNHVLLMNLTVAKKIYNRSMKSSLTS